LEALVKIKTITLVVISIVIGLVLMGNFVETPKYRAQLAQITSEIRVYYNWRRVHVAEYQMEVYPSKAEVIHRGLKEYGHFYKRLDRLERMLKPYMKQLTGEERS
jgi:hypothetical protein